MGGYGAFCPAVVYGWKIDWRHALGSGHK